MEVFAWQVSERTYGSKSLGAAQLGDDALAGPISRLDQRLGIWSLELTGLFLNGAGLGPCLSFCPWFGPLLSFLPWFGPFLAFFPWLGPFLTFFPLV